MYTNYKTLLNSSEFLNYPDLSKEIYTGMNDPKTKITLKNNYAKADSTLFFKIKYCFRSIIHKLYNNFSTSYSANFERVKADVLNKKGHDLDYFLHSNAFLNLPEISKLVFELIKQPYLKFTVQKNYKANDDGIFNRIYFIFSSIQHNFWLKVSSSYASNFKIAATKVSDAINSKIAKQAAKVKKEKEKIEKKTKLKEDNFVKSINEKYQEIDIKQKEFNDTKSFIKTLNEQIESITLKTSPEHLSIAEKIKRKTEIESNLSQNENTLKTFENEISNLEGHVHSCNNQINKLKSEQSNIVLNVFKNEDAKTQLANEIKTQENLLETATQKLNDQKTHYDALKISTKDLRSELKKIPKKIKKIETEIEEKLKTNKQDLNEKTSRLNLLATLLDNLKNGLKTHVLDETNNAIFESLKRDNSPLSTSEINLIQELLSPEKPKDRTKKDPIDVPTPKSNPEPKPEPKIEPEKQPEIIKTAKGNLIERLKQFNQTTMRLLESYLSRFDEQNILIFEENNGNFVIKLQKPLKLWVSKTTDTDPEGGSILIFGTENQIEGKLGSKQIEFTKGFEIYCKNYWLGLVTASVYSISENSDSQFGLTAGKVGVTKTETANTNDTINKWKDLELSEVVDGDHVAYLQSKLT